MHCGLLFMLNTLYIILLASKDNFDFSPTLKLIVVVILLVSLVFYFLGSRYYRKGTPGRKLSFGERFLRGKVEITLSGNRPIKPSYVLMTVRNIGNREVDLQAPVLIFKRWRSRRKFRILTVKESEIYPMFMDPGQESVVNISLNQFYQSVPELRNACRLSVEMNDDTGRKYKSRTIRLKWI
jgi:hypothetical protein